ncbi:MAG: transporter ATP-binding protein [Clostridiales bacterium]|jgi:ABC-type multidrug transport system ATPase subunit|nr:transporter ATP-binding protein [Clostridiales bacterium]
MKIKITNLSKAYKRGFNVLKDINLELESPSMIGLVGPNGAGKTTLMKLLVSQLLPSEGNIMIDGMELYKNEKYLKQRLGYLPQEFGLYEELTVYQFLDYMAALKGIKENRKDFIKKCIVITSLEDKQDIKIRTLSGGQKQRVGIAQALLSSPELFIVDEPTVGLDPEERIKFRNLFSKNASSKLVILSTHIIDDVESICNRLIVMSKGRILFDGTPSQLIKSAQGHVAKIELHSSSEELVEKNFKITSRVIVPNGLSYRIVGEDLPASSEFITPSLEDAYIYCIMEGDMA